uniref:ARAD1D34562p n=1 Tax=Blastobotrys adeninivorans TaxID=409370 RepID=A0A060TBT7_BLAAD
MDSRPEFQSVSIDGTKTFSWVFMVDWVLAMVLTIFIIFFFNRLVGSIISALVRLYFWRKHRVRLKVQSVQLSLLGGRLFFKNLTYVGSNEMISALQGNLTWRYWLHWRRISKLEASQHPGGDHLASESAPTRLKMHIDGLEWFVYNRSAAYDSLFDYISKSEKLNPMDTNIDAADEKNDAKKENKSHSRADDNTSSATTSNDNSNSAHLSDSSLTAQDIAFLRLLPLQVRFTKGAVVIGNNSTPSVLVLHCSSGLATLDASPSPNRLDKYQMGYDADLDNAILEMRDNIDYTGPSKYEPFRSKPTSPPTPWVNAALTAFNLLKKLNPVKNRGLSADANGEDPEKDQQPWKGLSRYISHDTDVSHSDAPTAELDPTNIVDEYAKTSVLVDARKCTLSYHYDIPGIVPACPPRTLAADGPDIGNGGAPPQFGATVRLENATVHYGPWADRQRVFLQSMLVPPYYIDATPERKRDCGEPRLYTQFKLLVEFCGDSIIRIPLRESSKNADFLAKMKESQDTGVSIRPFGWIEAKFKDESTLSFTTQLMATNLGSTNLFRLDMKYPEVRSSVNHGLLFSANCHKVDGKISYPLQWNGLQKWNISNHSTNVRTFFLREHVTLLSDLFNDFAMGPPVPYDLFVPCIYDVTWKIEHYGIFLNVNEANIINNPSDFEDNIFISFQGSLLEIGISVPMDQIARQRNTVDFSISTPRFDLVVDAPPWHTAHNFLDSKTLGRAHEFVIKGTYDYYATVEAGTTDTLVINANASDVTFVCYGFVLKYLMRVRENYFGEHAHFQTLEEFTSNSRQLTPEYKFTKNVNDTDVLLYVYVSNGTIVLPSCIYSPSSHLRLDFAAFDTDVRFTNYYMDLQMDITPARGVYASHVNTDTILDLAKSPITGSSDLFIDGIVIHGHRIFGLPPTEPTYFCRWDIDIGDVNIDSSFPFLDGFNRAIDCLIFSFKDNENSMLLPEPPLFDLLYLTVNISAIYLAVSAENVLLKLDAYPFKLDLNDLSNERYSKRLNLCIPTIDGSLLLQDIETASLNTSLRVTDFVQSRHAAHRYESQQKHLNLHDAPFQRSPFFIQSEYVEHFSSAKLIRPSMSLPPVPPPLNSSTLRLIDPSSMPMGHHSAQDSYNETHPSEVSVHSRDPHSVLLRGRPISRHLSSAASVPRLSTISQMAPAKDEPKGIDEQDFDFDNAVYMRPKQAKRIGVMGNSNSKLVKIMESESEQYFANNSEVRPRYSPEDNVECDNFIVQLGDVAVTAGPRVLECIEIFSKVSEQKDPDAIIDDLEKEVSKKISYIQHGEPETKNVRLIVPSVDFKYGANFEESYVFAHFQDISAAMRISVAKIPENLDDFIRHTMTYSGHQSVFFDLGSANIGIQKTEGSSPGVKPCVLQVGRTGFWLHDDQEACNTGTLRVKSIDALILSSHVEWTTNFLATSLRELENRPKSRRLSPSSLRVQLIHRLVVAGEEHKVEHDPPVLTKPAHVIRTSQHVRASTSWKILVRLRHLANHVPSKKLRNFWIEDSTPTLERTLKLQIRNIFSKWRSWELSNISESLFFRYLVESDSLKKLLLSFTYHFLLESETIGVRLRYPDEEDYVRLDYTKIVIEWKHFDSDNCHLNSMLSVGDIRTRVNYRVLNLVKDCTKQFPIGTGSTGEQTKVSKAGSAQSKYHVNIDLSLFVSEYDFLFRLPSVSTRLEGAGFKFAPQLRYAEGSVKPLLGILSSSELWWTLSVNRPKNRGDSNKMATLFVDNVTASVGSSDMFALAPKIGVASIKDIRVAVHKSMEDICSILVDTLKSDIWLFKQFEGTSESDLQSADGSFPYFGPLNVKLTLNAFRIDTQVFRSLRCLYRLDNIVFNIRQVDQRSLSCQLDVASQSLDVIGSDVANKLVKISIVDVETLSRIELAPVSTDTSALEILFNVSQVDFNIESLPDLLQQAEYILVQDEISSLSDAVNSLKAVIESEGKQAVDEGSTCKLAPNMNMFVKRATLVASVPQASLLFDTSNFSLRYSSFSMDSDDGIIKKPRFAGISTDESRVLILAETVPRDFANIFSVQGTLTYQERKGESDKDELEYTSELIRVMLGAESVAALYDYGKLLDPHLETISNLAKKPNTQEEEEEEEKPKAAAISSKMVGLMDHFEEKLNITLRLQNASVMWLFSSSSKASTSQGIMVGYESFELITRGYHAQTRLNGAFLTPVTDEYFADGWQVIDKPNTAYLPNIALKVKYFHDGRFPVLRASVTGDSLKILLVPSIVNIVAGAVDSVSNLSERFVQGADQPSGTWTRRKSIRSAKVPRKAPTKVRLPFSLTLKIKFAASVIQFWSDQGFALHRPTVESTYSPGDSGSNAPAIYLETPSFNAGVAYNLVDEGPDKFSMRLFISSSLNTVYPKSVPVIMEIVNDVKRTLSAFHQIKTQPKALEPVGPIEQEELALPDSKGSGLLNSVDVVINIRYGRQEIALSCMPAAKVSAAVSLDRLSLSVNTCENETSGRFYAMTCLASNFKMSLQHIYSREVSGFISVQDMMLFMAKREMSSTMLTGKIADIDFDVNMKQMQELELFMDIWRPRGLNVQTPVDTKKPEATTDTTDSGMVYRYHRASTTTAMPWSISLEIVNTKGQADLGQSVAKLSLHLDRFWLASRKKSNWEQSMVLGFDSIYLDSEGRIGGAIWLNQLEVRTAIMWPTADEDKDDQDFVVPLVQAVLKAGSVQCCLSLDFHMFMIAQLKQVGLSMTNQRERDEDGAVAGDDRLLVVGNCDSVDISMTGLAASHILDIYHTIARIRKESNASYNAILQDSAKGEDGKGTKGNKPGDKGQNRHRDHTLSNVIAKLRTVLDINIGGINLSIFPNRFTDSLAFIMSVNQASAGYGQGKENQYLESSVNLRIKDFVVALPTLRKAFTPAGDNIGFGDIGLFVTHVRDYAKGGTIIGIPTCHVNMTTWQEFGHAIVEYEFQSSFGGRVDIGWNLGSVNFIRDMWDAHARAFGSRRETYAMRSRSNVLAAVNLDENLKEVHLSPAYSYVPREPPIIDTPQLRDMGEATPPIEWIGLNRQRFPGLTHQVILLPLQSLVGDVELLYRQVLGRS